MIAFLEQHIVNVLTLRRKTEPAGSQALIQAGIHFIIVL
jgi:hypothetical protein